MTNQVDSFLATRPRLLEKYRSAGTFADHAADLAGGLTSKVAADPLTVAIVAEARRILGNDVDHVALERQLVAQPLLSTADHHALLTYDLLFNSNILHGEVSRIVGLPFNVVLPTGSIPLINRAYPRGFRFHGRKHNFFAHSRRNCPVFLFDEKLNADRDLGLDSLVPFLERGSISAHERSFLECLFFDALEVERANDLATYSDQLTFLNSKLWRHYFAAELRDRLPQLVYLQSNRIVEEVLVAEIADPGSLVAQILFDPAVRRMYLARFDGIQGCWSADGGTHFFWGVSASNAKIPLRLDSGRLIGGGSPLPLEPEALIAALRGKRILPAVFFDLLLITFQSGNLNLGGFNQVDYLPQMQAAHVACLERLGRRDLAALFASRVCDAFICGMFPFTHASGLDLIWERNSHDGAFTGTLDGGLTETDLEQVRAASLHTMIGSAIAAMERSS